MPMTKHDGDWAAQVPNPRWKSPYRDFGWEMGESVLPEFQDPDVRQRIQRSQRGPGGQAVPEGPYTGVGPRNYKRSDERICEDVSARLTEHGWIDASDIDVNVDNGEVTLTGTVDSRATKRLAEDIADSVPGVRDVHNRLTFRRELPPR